MEVGGDPVGSIDPEVFKDLQPCTKLGMQNALAHNSGRSAPDWCLFWALNAHLLPISGVERQNHACSGVQRPEAAHFGRSAPAPCSVLALNARQMLLQGVIFLLLFLIPFSIFIFIL